MTELTDKQKEEISELLTEIDDKIKEVRPKCSNDTQLDILNDVEKSLDKFRVKQ